MVNFEFIISHEIHICNWTLKLLLGNTREISVLNVLYVFSVKSYEIIKIKIITLISKLKKIEYG